MENLSLPLKETKTIHHEMDYPDWIDRLLSALDTQHKEFTFLIEREGSQFNIHMKSTKHALVMFSIPSPMEMQRDEWLKKESEVLDSIKWWIDYIINHQEKKGN